MKNLFKISSFVILSASLFIACSDLNPFSNQGKFKVKYGWTPSDVSISCGENSTAKECNGSVGIMFSKSHSLIGDSLVSRCTAWVHQPDIIVANMHCVQQSKESLENKSLSNSYFKLIDSAPVANKTFRIKEVIRGFISKDTDNFGVDYAFMRLDRKLPDSIPSVSLDHSPIKIGETLRVVSINAVNGNEHDDARSYVLDTFNCEVSNENVLFPYEVGASSPWVGLYSCPIVGGNSGSPAFNTNGQAKAIIWGKAMGEYWRGNIKYDISDKLRSLNLSEFVDYWTYYDVDEYAIATSMECIPDLEEGTSKYVSSNCKPMKFAKSDSELREAIMALVERKFDEIKEHMKRDPQLNYKLGTPDIENSVVFTTEVDSKSSWRDNEATFVANPSCKTNRGHLTTQVYNYKTTVTLKIDREARLVVENKTVENDYNRAGVVVVRNLPDCPTE